MKTYSTLENDTIQAFKIKTFTPRKLYHPVHSKMIPSRPLKMKKFTPRKMKTSSTLENVTIQAFKNENIYTRKNDNILYTRKL
jgi:hypothetical protein